jgi:photosystem II stability/assembly factor-like uncharacterized protein
MADRQQGWGVTAFSGPSQQFLHTTTGGRTWADVTPRGYTTNPGEVILAVRSATEAWATSNATAQGTGQSLLWHSTDSGATWHTFTIATSPIVQIDFLDAQHGWIVSTPNCCSMGPNPFDLWHTANGGVTWKLIGQGSFALGVIATTFVTTTLGVQVTAFPGPPDGGFPVALRTQDGGHTWSPISLPTPNLGSPITYSKAEAPVFTSTQDGSMGAIYMTSANNTYLAVYLTHDGGATWQLSVVKEDQWCLDSLHAATARFIACAQGQSTPVVLYHQVGSSWVSVPITPASAVALEGMSVSGSGMLDMISATTGWAIATKGLFRTTDGGVQWSLLIAA